VEPQGPVLGISLVGECTYRSVRSFDYMRLLLKIEMFGFIFIRSQNHILVSWLTTLHATRRLKCVRGLVGDGR
jgi:hypothetical protein